MESQIDRKVGKWWRKLSLLRQEAIETILVFLIVESLKSFHDIVFRPGLSSQTIIRKRVLVCLWFRRAPKVLPFLPGPSSIGLRHMFSLESNDELRSLLQFKRGLFWLTSSEIVSDPCSQVGIWTDVHWCFMFFFNFRFKKYKFLTIVEMSLGIAKNSFRGV